MANTVHSESDLLILRALAQRIDPGDAGAFNNLGVVYYQKSLYEDAIEQFRRALQIDAKMEVARRNLDIAYHQTGYYDRRIAELIGALQTDQTNDDARLELAEAYFHTGRVEKAISQYDTLVQRRPADIRVLMKLGAAEQSRGELKRALHCLERAREVDAEDPAIYYSLGEILYNQGMNEEAIAHLKKALQLNPSVAEAHHLLGFVYGDLGDSQKAAEHAERAADLNPAASRVRANLSIDRYSSARYTELTGSTATPTPMTTGKKAFAHYTLGVAFRARGLYDEARQEFARAREANEDEVLVDQAEAELALLEGNAQGALELYNSLIFRNRNSAKLWNERGVSLHQMGRLEEAEDSYHRALKIDEEYALAWNNVAVVRAHSADMVGAETALEHALEARPSLDDAQLNLGLLWIKTGRNEKSLNLHREILGGDPTRADAWNGLGSAYMAMGQHVEARNAFVRAVESNPESTPARYNLSFVLARLGDHEGALRETKSALELDPYYTAPRYRLSIDLQYEGGELWAPELASPERVAAKEPVVRDFKYDPAELDSAFESLEVVEPEEELEGNPFELARDYLANGLYDRGLAEAVRAVRAGAAIGEGDLIIGEIYFQRGLFGESLERFQEAWTLRPDDPEALAGVARSLLQLNRIDEAKRMAEELRPKAGENVSYLLIVGEALTRAGDPVQALEVLDQAADVAPRDPVVHRQMARAALAMGNRRRAREAYRAAIAADPDFAAARVELGRILIDEGEYANAEAEIRRALELMPSYAEASLVLADLLSRQGRTRETINMIADFLEYEPHNLDALVALGEALAKEGRRRDAERALNRVLRFDAKRTVALFRLGELSTQSGRYRDALAYWDRLIETAPDSEYAARARVQGRMALGLDRSFEPPVSRSSA